MESRQLGASELEVSRLSLGSWRTFERIGRDDGLAVMRAAREHGITFLDDARYNDETGRAPIPTGYSEVLFGELFRAAGWDRASTIVSNKLWWEFWPEQDAAAELDGSLGRMRFDHIDLIYANPPPDGLPVGGDGRRRRPAAGGRQGARLGHRQLGCWAVHRGDRRGFGPGAADAVRGAAPVQPRPPRLG